MKSLILFITITWFVVNADYVPKYDPDEIFAFNEYKREHGKTYTQPEEDIRKAIYIEHLRLIHAHNLEKPQKSQWDVNSYTDLVPLEIPRGLTWHLTIHKKGDGPHPKEHHHHQGKKDPYHKDE
ncbi:hypothetical protein ILUMI_05154 [Ignelater luminosus]|uniref:Cathepsin propeptide inhibitor domain-containing protein n=1 Tax=Ignelater luminosus TaxID=2038154 RepID=A0A8K0D888_IGNLU|nr:hypothetical protein ILUMI_05154 [Ignelater luminosus]